MEGRIAIVTGAGAGIGAAIALRFAAAGAAVAVADVDGGAAEATVRAICDAGGRAHAIVSDLAEAGAAEGMVREAVAALGPVEVLVNNAGAAVGGTVIELTDADWRRLWAINVEAGVAAARCVLPAMIKCRRGVILFVSSSAALLNVAGAVAYNATKAAQLSIVRTMAGDHGAAGVRVNAIIPGGVLTAALERSAKAGGASVESMSAHVPLQRRFARVEEVAAAALFLASDEASYITGHGLVVDGGLTATSVAAQPA